MFQLAFDIPKSKQRISIHDTIYLSGSCFSDELGTKLRNNKFRILSNPFGTIYNPYSILKSLRGEIHSGDNFQTNEIHYNWNCHSLIRGNSEKELVEQLHNAQENSQKKLSDADWLILTFGTSFVYRLKSNGQIVANCHRFPHDSFEKGLLSVEEINREFNYTLQFLKKSNKKLKVILTVSPVRHLRDGIIENNHSKAILLQAVHQLVKSNENVQYFPSYEILIDQLRDYRFYAADMVHPSLQAVDYIWERFIDTYLDHDSLSFLNEWQAIAKAINHQPFNPNTDRHQKFLKDLIIKLENLGKITDTISEIKYVESKLK